MVSNFFHKTVVSFLSYLCFMPHLILPDFIIQIILGDVYKSRLIIVHFSAISVEADIQGPLTF